MLAEHCAVWSALPPVIVRAGISFYSLIYEHRWMQVRPRYLANRVLACHMGVWAPGQVPGSARSYASSADLSYSEARIITVVKDLYSSPKTKTLQNL
ncbi:hypothetical protein RRG08_055118 [Elysia crispata]|uniref:Uncharacterized protein n=1 Tax=Elysia crispata TaxID=231223 RepID=A0AAE1AL82_9GAST|nr:hypothetical protein RRG08_055118 [Elysia crispata]